ncbi:glycosyl hydrolases family 31-domain-containing protein [Coniochaeta sp. 2T2.1]|nr:glycosyl hydrolases family 31-domain-containing protein [Coniochaeta sp. 2T2.1]
MIGVLALIVAATAAAATVDDCPGYKAFNVKKGCSSVTADLKLAGSACNVYGDDIPDLKLLVEYQTDKRLHVKIYDADENVYQVQESVIPRPKNEHAKPSAIRFSLVEDPFSFAVTRSSGEVLFNTSGQQLVFESQYLRLRTSLPPNVNLYGLGEHSDDFRFNNNNGYQRVFWNMESPFIPRNANLYGSHPVYVDYRGASGTHGVFLLNANGMNININATSLEYNTIGGIFDFYFLAGPDPVDVSRQYAEVVGLPAMVPYWSFGFHQCKYGWPNVDYVTEVVANYSKADIPLETLWGDIDYMDHRQDFTLDPTKYPLTRMRDLVDKLHRAGQRYVMMLDPGIRRKGGYEPFETGADRDVFHMAADGSYYRGSQWAGEVVWPDWLHPNTQEWWTGEIQKFFDPQTGVDIDGLWNDMNEASNFCQDVSCDPTERRKRQAHSAPAPVVSRDANATGTKLGLPNRNLFDPAYHVNNHRGSLSGSTIYTNVSNADGTVQYDTHNLYGHTMAMTSRNALIARKPTKRPFVLTRSTFAGSGAVAAHWFGDNYSAWDDYRISIKQMLAFVAIHQMSMVGSDVCGFNGNVQEIMCARWAVMAAWQPFYRNHADISAPSQEFYRWESMANAARQAIKTRYRLLDYIYTAMDLQSRDGTPAVSPVWFLYPSDEAAAALQTQWFLGDALLVAPVVEDDGDGVDVYLPTDVFYDFWTGKRVMGEGKAFRVQVALEDIPVYIRGGSVVPMRVDGANTTAELRKKNFELVVAPGSDGSARGQLYFDDGDSLEVGGNKSDLSFVWGSNKLVINGTFGYSTDVVLEKITVLGGGEATVKEGSWSLNKPIEVDM